MIRDVSTRATMRQPVKESDPNKQLCVSVVLNVRCYHITAN